MNKLKSCKLKKYNRWIIGAYKCAFFAILCIIYSSCTKTSYISKDLQKIADEVWIDSDSALVHLTQLDTTNYSDYEKNYWHLQYQHAYLRVHQQPMKDPNPSIDSLLTFLSQNTNPLIVGEIYYVKANELLSEGMIVLANKLTQQAAAEWEKVEVSAIKRGMLLKKMGDIALASELYQVAMEYYKQSIEILKETDCPAFYVCIIYSCMGAIEHNSVDSIDTQDYYQEAMNYAGADSALYYEMLFEKYYTNSKYYPDSLIISTGQYVVDSLKRIDEALNLANWFISHNYPAYAKKYLDISQANPKLSPRDKIHLRYFWGHYLYQIGNVEAAYHHMCRVYENQFWQNIKDRNNFNFETTHQIEREQQILEQERLRRHQQLLILALAATLLLAAIIVLSLMLRSRKLTIDALDNQNQLLKERNKALEEKQRLEREVMEKRAKIRAQLEQRVELSRQLSLYQAHHHQLPQETPQWLNEFIHANEFTNKHNGDELIAWVNSSYYNCLDKIQEKNPSLTTTDLQIIALVVLDFDATDISILQNIGIGAVNNRQSGIKRKLDIPSDKSLRDWLMQFLHQ